MSRNVKDMREILVTTSDCNSGVPIGTLRVFVFRYGSRPEIATMVSPPGSGERWRQVHAIGCVVRCVDFCLEVRI